MPFIDSKISVKVSEEQKERLKEEFGKAIAIIHKPESFLMLGFEDSYDLYMGGKKLDRGAYLSVSLFGDAPSSSYAELTAKLCDILKKELDIPGDAVYITYHGVHDWGWDGRNF